MAMRLRHNTGDSDSTISDSFLTSTLASLASMQAGRGLHSLHRHNSADPESVGLLTLEGGEEEVTFDPDSSSDEKDKEVAGVVKFDKGLLILINFMFINI